MVTSDAGRVDPNRALYRKPDDPRQPFDTEAPDAVWVPVTGGTFEAVTDPEAQRVAAAFVANKFGSNDGHDRVFGPIPDDGKQHIPYVDPGAAVASQGHTSADDYLLEASRQGMAPKHDRRYIAYYRIRRLHILG